MSEAEKPPDAPRPKYEGPFKHRGPRDVDHEDELHHHRSRWLSPGRLYGVGMLAALAISAVYVSKMMITPEMIRASREDAPEVQPPRPTLRAFCLSAATGAPTAVEPSPFCTEASPPACRAGDTLQLAYGTNAVPVAHVTAAVMGGDFAPIVVAPSTPVHARAVEAPLGQWKVTSNTARRPVALLAIFSREPLTDADLAPWWQTWRTGVRLLERPPPFTPAMERKGTLLEAFRACVGR